MRTTIILTTILLIFIGIFAYTQATPYIPDTDPDNPDDPYIPPIPEDYPYLVVTQTSERFTLTFDDDTPLTSGDFVVDYPSTLTITGIESDFTNIQEYDDNGKYGIIVYDETPMVRPTLLAISYYGTGSVTLYSSVLMNENTEVNHQVRYE
jgi:hypothetical protein